MPDIRTNGNVQDWVRWTSAKANQQLNPQGKHSPTLGWLQHPIGGQNFWELHEDRVPTTETRPTTGQQSDRVAVMKRGLRAVGPYAYKKSDFTQKARGGSGPGGLDQKIPAHGTAKGPEISETQIWMTSCILDPPLPIGANKTLRVWEWPAESLKRGSPKVWCN